MYSILFVCHGNICRSPMAESVMSFLAELRGFRGKIGVGSAAARTDEIGSPPHFSTRRKLEAEGIPVVPHRARLMTEQDGETFDLLIGMDKWNVQDMRRIVGKKNEHKVKMLLDFSARPRAIADPWYTGDFDATFRDVYEGCEGLLSYLQKECLI